MATMQDAAVRVWCQALARTLQVQHISPKGMPYLERYFVAGRSPTNQRAGPAVYLHHFVASDPDDAVHTHPWEWSASLILVGGYREERCVNGKAVVREYRPGHINVLAADDQHRIDLLGSECWSLFLAGRFEKMWTFAPRCAE